jgi:hypothetical protein
MNMGQKLKIVGWLSVGALAGALTTISLQTTARGTFAPLPLEELQQLAAVFGMVKSDYVETVDEKNSSPKPSRASSPASIPTPSTLTKRASKNSAKVPPVVCWRGH